MDFRTAINKLECLADPTVVEGMERFGITAAKIYGVSMPELRKLAIEMGKNHELALQLWGFNSRETRILSSLTDDPEQVSIIQADNCVRDFDSWESCDQCIMNLLEKTPFAWDKAFEWSNRQREFEKRAGFVMMARLAVSDKKSPDSMFEQFLPIILRESTDSRNFVKKAVNWALRQIGKRSFALNEKALATAVKMIHIDSSAARWIASDAIRELQNEKIRARIKR